MTDPAGDCTAVDEVAVDPERAAVHVSGWQSWSPTGTYPAAAVLTGPATAWEQAMRWRPETPAPVAGVQSEGLLVVDPGTGADARLYAAADPTQQVPSIRARLAGRMLQVEADGPVTTRAVTGGVGRALAAYAGGLADSLRLPPPRRAPTVWCSWYRYFTEVTEVDIAENLDGLDRTGLPVQVVQLDDGWQAGIGDWLRLSGRIPSLPELARRITDRGRRAGIWVAPFVAGRASALARDHPDWLLGDAGHNWGQDLRGLDLRHPDVLGYLTEVFTRLRTAGFDYYKLDFLYAGALPGRGPGDRSGVAAYRAGLHAIREAVGADAYLVGCGAPLLPSVGLVDAMRVSPDTFHPDGGGGMGRLRGRAGTEARSWQHGRWWVNDPDCLVLRPAFRRRAEWAGVVERFGGLRALSDRIAELDDWGRATAHRLLTTVPPAEPFPELAHLDRPVPAP